jgi:hypothetical protein
VQLIELETRIAAPPERCFLLSLNIDLHMDSLRPYFIKFLKARNAVIQRVAESPTEEWRHYLG